MALFHFRFVYKFKARVSGTMFYHSHAAFQRGDGAFGAYIVRQAAESDPNSHLYDYDLTEHLIFPQEWFHQVNIAPRQNLNFDSFLIAGNQGSLCFAPLVKLGKKINIRIIDFEF